MEGDAWSLSTPVVHGLCPRVLIGALLVATHSRYKLKTVIMALVGCRVNPFLLVYWSGGGEDVDPLPDSSLVMPRVELIH